MLPLRKTRLEAALEAIEAVLEGAVADDIESEWVDFKEETGTVQRDSSRVSIDPQDETAAAKLAEEVGCYANTMNGGALVVGVRDDVAGRAAFVGSYLDTTWLRNRIWELTSPHHVVEIYEIDDERSNHIRIYVIDVQPGVELVRVRNKLVGRIDKKCQPIEPTAAIDRLRYRKSFDWSVQRSGVPFRDADPAAVEALVARYRAVSDDDGAAALEVARRLRLIVEEHTGVPELTRAGELLLTHAEPNRVQIEIRREEVADDHGQSEKLRAPLLLALQRVFDTLETAFPQRSRVLVEGQAVPLRSVPIAAAREAVINAVVHRDYEQQQAAVVVRIIGAPADTLQVESPGGFPPGINDANVLGAPSRPRNPSLATTLHGLRYGEGQGKGIGVMYRELLLIGSEPPTIHEAPGGYVVAHLQGGQPDLTAYAYFASLPDQIRRGARPLIAIEELTRHPTLRPRRLAELGVYTEPEARATLNHLEEAGVIEKIVAGGRTYLLTAAARAALGHRISYRTRTRREELWPLIRALFDTRDEIVASDLDLVIEKHDTTRSRLLATLVDDGRLIKHGKTKDASYTLGPRADD